jgi:hypothetical protein
LNVNESSSNLKINCNKNTNISTDWVFNPYTNINSIGSFNLAAENKFAMEDLCTNIPQTDAIDWYFGQPADYYNNGPQCIPNYRKFPKNQAITGITPIPQITPKLGGINSCTDSTACHISRWTPDLNSNYSGSIIYFPPSPPPNKDFNDIHIKEEENRILNGIPLIHDNPRSTVISGKNAEISQPRKNGTNQIFPNPVSLQNPKLSFSNISISNILIKIYNLNGQEIEYDVINLNTIQLKNISQGVYIVKIIYDNCINSIRLTVVD